MIMMIGKQSDLKSSENLTDHVSKNNIIYYVVVTREVVCLWKCYEMHRILLNFMNARQML